MYKRACCCLLIKPTVFLTLSLSLSSSSSLWLLKLPNIPFKLEKAYGTFKKCRFDLTTHLNSPIVVPYSYFRKSVRLRAQSCSTGQVKN